MNRIKSNWFFTVFHQMRYNTSFRLIRNDSKRAGKEILKWLGIALIHFNPNPFLIIPNQSERRFVSRLMENSQKSIQVNLVHSASMRLNPIHSTLIRGVNWNKSQVRMIRNLVTWSGWSIALYWKLNLNSRICNWGVELTSIRRESLTMLTSIATSSKGALTPLP